MINKIIKLIRSEAGLYLIFGFMTTIVNYVTFWLALQILGYEEILVVNTISFISAVVFAYITNKIFVFKSKEWKWSVLRKELISFISARILSYLFEQLGLFFSANILHLEKYIIFGVDGVLISKVILSFAVVLLNWFISKFYIFKKG